MPYTLVKTNGDPLVTIPDGNANGPGFTTSTAATNLVFPGPNFTGYGNYLNENLLKLLENFAGPVAPLYTNLPGQLWWNTNNKTLYVFADNQTGYTPVNGILVDGTKPAIGTLGTIWFNNLTNQISIYGENHDYNLVGPLYTSQQGVSGAIPTTITASTQVNYDVLVLKFGVQNFAIFSGYYFVPKDPIPGFPEIRVGLTLNNTFTGTGLNSDLVGNVTGRVTGSTFGTHTGAVIGPVTGDITGNITGIVTGPTYGLHTGNVAGSLNGLRVDATTGAFSNLTATTLTATGGSATGLTTVATQNLSASGWANISGNVISGGLVSPTLYSTNLYGTILSPAQNSIQTLSGLTSFNSTLGTVTNFGATTGVVTNFSTANAVVTGGSVTGLANLRATVSVIDTLNSTTVRATAVNAVTIGNTGATLTGTLNTATQNGITTASNLVSVGTLTTGTWNASTLTGKYGGTGVDNGTYTLTLNNSYTLNQAVTANSSPYFVATNFTGTATGLTAGSATSAQTANSAISLATVNFKIEQVGATLYIKYGSTIIATIDQYGNFITKQNITAYGSPT